MFTKLRTTLGRLLLAAEGSAASGRQAEELAHKTLQIQREAFLLQLLADPRYADPRRLNRFESRVFSQSGQDGILGEIFRRIGTTNRRFVEFGVGAGGGFENNTTYLLGQGWQGAWMDANPAACTRIRAQAGFLLESGQLQLLETRVTAATIVSLFQQLQVPAEFDLLSIDIDSDDYWVWEQLTAFRPRVVVIEYNSFLPATADWVLPVVPNRAWQDCTIEFGASLAAFDRLGRQLGYHLVACDTTGSDAFFVRADLVDDKFAGPFTPAEHYEPMRYHLIQPWGYRRALTPTFGRIQ